MGIFIIAFITLVGMCLCIYLSNYYKKEGKEFLMFSWALIGLGTGLYCLAKWLVISHNALENLI